MYKPVIITSTVVLMVHLRGQILLNIKKSLQYKLYEPVFLYIRGLTSSFCLPISFTHGNAPRKQRTYCWWETYLLIAVQAVPPGPPA